VSLSTVATSSFIAISEVLSSRAVKMRFLSPKSTSGPSDFVLIPGNDLEQRIPSSCSKEKEEKGFNVCFLFFKKKRIQKKKKKDSPWQ
jgi:hypothetical protein